MPPARFDGKYAHRLCCYDPGLEGLARPFLKNIGQKVTRTSAHHINHVKGFAVLTEIVFNVVIPETVVQMVEKLKNSLFSIRKSN